MEDKFLRDLRTIDGSCFLNFIDLDSICEDFNSNVKTVAEKHALLKVRLKHGSLMIFFKASKRGIFFNNKQTMIGLTSPRKGTKSTTSNTNLSRSILIIFLSMMLSVRNNLVPNGKNTITSVKRLVTEDGNGVTSPN